MDVVLHVMHVVVMHVVVMHVVVMLLCREMDAIFTHSPHLLSSTILAFRPGIDANIEGPTVGWHHAEHSWP